MLVLLLAAWEIHQYKLIYSVMYIIIFINLSTCVRDTVVVLYVSVCVCYHANCYMPRSYIENKALLSLACKFATCKTSFSGIGSNRVLQGLPIQVVGMTLITDYNYYFVEVVF